MLDVVGGRTQLKKAGARYVGRCPFHEERTPSFSVNPVDKLFYCFGCGKGGDLISFVRETENVDFAGAIEWLGERFRVPLEYEETSPAADAARKRRERLYAVLEQATSFYERYLWETAAGRAGARVSLGAGLGEEICREFRLGLSPVVFGAGAEGRREGIHEGRAGCCRPRQPARQRLLQRQADVPAGRRAGSSGRLQRAKAPRGRSAAGEVRQLTGRRPLPQVIGALRAAPGAPRDREGGAGDRRRGQHRCDCASPGRPGAGRGVDGNRAHRAAPRRAQAADAAPLPVLRRRRGGTGGDAARHGAGGKAGLRGQGRAAGARARPG